MTRTERLSASWASLLVLAVLAGALLCSCSSGDPSDQSLDKLERAVSELERSLVSARQAFGERLSAEAVDRLGADGAQVQVAYAEVKTMANDQLTPDQSKRRSELTERAVSAVGDMLNLRLSDEKQ